MLTQRRPTQGMARAHLGGFQEVGRDELLDPRQAFLLAKVLSTQEREVVVGVYVVQRQDEIDQRLSAVCGGVA